MSETGGGPTVYIYELEVVQTPVNVPSIFGDERPTDDSGNTVMYSIYASTPFTIDLEFTLYQIDEANPLSKSPIQIGALDCQVIGGYTGITFTFLNTLPTENPRVRMSGSISGGSVNMSETYRFVLDEENFPQVVSVPSQIPNDFLAIIEWIAPSIPTGYVRFNGDSGGYKFTANGASTPSQSTDELIMTQYIYWNYAPAITAFKQIVAQGKV